MPTATTKRFTDKPNFRPIFTIEQMLQGGIYGGTLFSRWQDREFVPENFRENIYFKNNQNDYNPAFNLMAGVTTPKKLATEFNHNASTPLKPFALWYFFFSKGRRANEDDQYITYWAIAIKRLYRIIKATLPEEDWYDPVVAPNITQLLFELAWDRTTDFETLEIHGTPIDPENPPIVPAPL